MLSTKDFYYDLPEERIAQTPAEPRDSSRLMIYNRAADNVVKKNRLRFSILKEAAADMSGRRGTGSTAYVWKVLWSTI